MTEKWSSLLMRYRDFKIKWSDYSGHFATPWKYLSWGMKFVVKKYSTHRYGSNEVSTLSIGVFFGVLWTFWHFLAKRSIFGSIFIQPQGYTSEGIKQILLTNESIHRYGSNEVSILSIGVYFVALWTFSNNFWQKCGILGVISPGVW